MSRDERARQLLEVAWRLAREEGADALTLPRLAECAGVTKPVVYDHYASRAGLLAALYQDYDRRQTARMDEALASSADNLRAKAKVMADAYVTCVMSQGREIPGVVAALAGSPELDRIKRDYEREFMARCRKVLAPYAPGALSAARLWALLGAAEALSFAAAAGELGAAQARVELADLIRALVERPQAR
ncbi:TetR/AcrR family transcriptional regulator [Myxococcus stipitatus]|uniref:TetR/AcrR family transcriptional regulator n=1 Tax=Myxococcus stipitatus TaxID=83455 RepID=UPI001F1D01C4|nr:TetR/AcrR family transcriptional regulator [Myxococcus stipitatus]MCE9673376.1 TetR/AcrR family transcriptional regulator [Myxococcus stipitatus]